MVYLKLMGASEKLGIIDTLSAGFGTINRHLWLVAVPLVLDLLLLLGPKIHAASLVNQALDDYHQLLLQSDLLTASQQEVSPDRLEQVFTDITKVAEPIGQLNLLGVLGWQMQGLMGSTGDASLGLTRIAVFDVGSIDLLVCVLFILAMMGVLWACIYLGAIAQVVQGSRF
ncbi:MAG: hypothetical protein ABIH46_01635, partial [Chloroflexota bacterium]